MTTDAQSTRPGEYRQELHRALSLKENIYITLSSVTPASSVFIIVPALIGGLGGASVAAMLIAAVIAVLVALCYAELATRHPIAGGEYTWAARLLGRPAGFGAFALTLVSGVLITALISTGVGGYLSVVWASAASTNTVVIVMALSTLVACLRIRMGAWVLGAFLAIELVALLVLSVLGFLNVERGVGTFFEPRTLTDSGLGVVGWGTLMSLVSVGLFAYNGYGAAVYYAEETKQSRTNIGRAIMISLGITVAVELIPVMGVVLGSSTLDDLIAGGPGMMNWFLVDRGSDTLNQVISIGIALAVFNAVIAIQIQIARLPFSSARDQAWVGPINRLLGSVSARTKTPVVATVLVGIVTAVVGRWVSFDFLLRATGTGLVVVYVIVAIAALAIRRRTDGAEGGYRMPGWPIPPLAVIAMMVYVALEQLKISGEPLWWSIGFFALGVVWFAAHRMITGSSIELAEAPLD